MFEEPNNLCRLCLSEESLVSIFVEESCYQWILDYLSIQISVGDGMSQTICALCRLKLAEFHQFRNRCREVQGVLLNKLKKAHKQSAIDAKRKPKSPKKSKTIQCSDCLKAFKSKKDLCDHARCHRKNNRANAKQLHCSECPKVFQSRKQLTDHRRYHFAKHACPRCGKAFAKRTDLPRHLKFCTRRKSKQPKHSKENDDSNTTEPTLDQLQMMEAESLEEQNTSTEITQLGAVGTQKFEISETHVNVYPEDLDIPEIPVKIEFFADDV
nr:zinc finger protein 157-like [Aedes albopictus]